MHNASQCNDIKMCDEKGMSKQTRLVQSISQRQEEERSE